MEPELEPGFDLNYLVPLSKELPGFSGSGSEPGSITRKKIVFSSSHYSLSTIFTVFLRIPTVPKVYKR